MREARLDKPFQSWGGFRLATEGSPLIHGLLRYAPEKAIEVDLVENPHGKFSAMQGGTPEPQALFGTLVDGTLVTLTDCFVTESSLGAGVGSPTTVFVNRALLGRHVVNLDALPVRRYAVEVSSLANWACASPLNTSSLKVDGSVVGIDAGFRLPDSIRVSLSDRGFDVEIAHRMEPSWTTTSWSITWPATLAVVPHGGMSLGAIGEPAWQLQNLMTLLIGRPLSVKAVSITPHDDDGGSERPQPLQLVFMQREKHDHPDVHAPDMLLPYSSVKDIFPQIVRCWFARNKQATLALNVFFASQYAEWPAVEARFLFAIYSAEAYHRSLGTGVYMDQEEYDKAIAGFKTSIPPQIEGDHRKSLESRLMYGNEHSLRKRLTEMFDRIPDDARSAVGGGDAKKFVAKAVDTRNYFTHFDHDAAANAFAGKDAHAATQRIRILIVANLLHDLGTGRAELLGVLRRNREFDHCINQNLPS